MGNFLKKAFQDMAESARAQHEVDKANFAAAKAESWRSWKDQKAEWRDQSPHSQFDFSREHCLPWARGTAPGGGFENSQE